MGTINGSGPYLRCRIEYSITTGTGGATVSATLYAQNQDNAYFQAHLYEGYSLTIDGSTKSGSGGALSGSRNGSVALLSHSKWIAYTGTRGNITISSHFGPLGVTINGTYIGERNASGSVAMPKVGSAPTKSTLTAPTNATVAENTKSIVVKWNSGSSYNGKGMYRVDVSINGGAWQFVSGDLAWGTTQWTYNISNGAQGNTYKFRIDTGNDVGWSGHTESGTVTLNKLNPPSIGTLNTWNPFVNTSVSIPLSGGSQTTNEAFMRRCDIYVGNKIFYCGKPSNGNTSISVSTTTADCLAQLGKTRYAASNLCKAVAWTENARGARSTYVEKYFPININTDGGATPTLGAFTLSGGVTSIGGSSVAYGSHVFLAGRNNIVVSSPAASLRRAPSGTTVSYKIECTSKNAINAQSGTFTSLAAGQKTIKVTATDSRGLSASQTKTVMVQNYTLPSITKYTVTRLSSPETSAQVTYTLSYSPIYKYTDGVTAGDQLNAIYSQQIRKDTSTAWANIASGNSITGLNADTVYNVELRVSDKMFTGEYSTASTNVPTITTTLALRKHGVGVRCVPQSSYAFEVKGDANFNNNIRVGGSLTVAGNGVELYHSAPYIDFHYGYSTADYTHRIMADNSTHLRFSTPIKYKGSASSWYTGRDNAFIRTVDTPTTSQYVPILSSKSNTGSWDLGVYQDDKMYLSFVTDANYNAGNNTTTTQYEFRKDGTAIIPYIETPNYVRIHGSRFQSFRLTNSNTTNGGVWVYLGELSTYADSDNTYVKVYTGNGYNARPDQNTIINIQIKDAWQEANKGCYDAYGVTYTQEGQLVPGIQVKFRTTAGNVGRLYLWLPWNYRAGHYTVETRGIWRHVMTESTSAPSVGIDQQVKFKGGGDTGWVDYPTANFSGNFANNSDAGKLRMRRVGNTVFLVGGIKKTTGAQPAASSDTYVGMTIPAGYRPSVNSGFVIQGSGMNRVWMHVHANGNVYFQRYGTTTSSEIPVGTWFAVNCVWACD